MDNKEILTPKIFTLRGLTDKNILSGKRALDVGCGGRKLPGSLGMDIISVKGVDVVHDLSVFPWPLENNSFELVFMNSVLEHVPNVLKTMEEIYRISKPGARLIVKVPYFRSTDAFADPTHYHYFTSRSMDFFMEGTEFRHYGYTDIKFKKIGFWYGWPHPSANPFKQLLKKFIHRCPDFYDKYLSLLMPIECVFWELEADK